MNEAIEIYKSLSSPPETALKKITGGRLSGMTDIKPQWRIKILTEKFGLCGIGWKYTVDRQWTESGAEGEVFAFVNILLYVKDDEKWSEAIPGTGGSMLIAKEQKGLHCNDEAFKMATTDALSVAAKHIGVAADVYMGHTSGKYDNKPNPAQQVKDEFQGTELTDADIMKPGQEIIKEYWKMSQEEKRQIMPKGYKATKGEDKKWYVKAVA